MGKFSELKEFVSKKYEETKNAFLDYRQQKRDEKEIREMAYYLHVYFDQGGLGLTSEEIEKVNKHICNTMVLSQISEMENFKKFVCQMTSLNCGMEALQKDRDAVMARINKGEVISKSDACVIAKKVILNDKEIKSQFFSPAIGKGVEAIIRPFNIYSISMDPNKDQPLTTERYNPTMDKNIKMFRYVRDEAFKVKVQ